MKLTAIIFVLVVAIFTLTAVGANAQTPVVFEKGSTEKTLTVTVGPKDMKTFSLTVKKGQVINFEASGDIQISKTEEFPVIGINLSNGVEDVDQWQDGEAYLSILAGRTGKYVVAVNNSDTKRVRTFKLKVAVTNDKADFAGGDVVK